MRPSIQLCSGKFFDFTSFGVKDIVIEDIASATAKLCRFTGHCKTFYSVAQHSVLVSRLVPPEHALAGLLHDATEAYINDLSRPLKLLNPQYVEYEHSRLWPIIAARFDLPDVLPPCIKDADNIALVTERRDLMPLPTGAKDEWHWARDIPRLPDKIKALEWRAARSQFMTRYRVLIKKRK
jgi:5'-nucleotidase